MKKVISYIRMKKYYMQARVIINFNNIKNRILFALNPKKRKVLIESEFQNGVVLILAMYEKGKIRKDIENLCKTAKSMNIFVIAVNTRKLYKEYIKKDLFDCYIERKNYGRDFGSYKEGFMYIYEKGINKKAKRIIILNDSVFYSKTHMRGFLKKLAETDIQALGATENFEFNHHLGSFCISISKSIFNNKKFISYWKKYKLTDIRPRVIKRGEIELSKTLLRCAADGEVRALYSSVEFIKYLQKNDFLDYCLKVRANPKIGWERMRFEDMVRNYVSEYIHRTSGYENISSLRVDVEMGKINEIERFKQVENFSQLKKYICERYKISLSNESAETLRKCIISYLVGIFRSGSQIHKNAPILLRMGCAIIKIDGLYRGAFDDYTILYIVEQLDDDDRQELLRILQARPFGGETLTKWKLAAFNRGLI